MHLRDLVANSLPRLRSRKKKAPVVTGASSGESAAKLEVRPGCSSLEKAANRHPAVRPRGTSRDDSIEAQGIAEASWRGNALYRGLEAARAVKFNSEMMSTSFTSSHGMVTSHSAEGFSTQLMLMSRSYDSRMTVPESCPQMSSITEARVEPFAYPQQYYHCHYHKHNHHHYHHHHHLHSKPMTPVAQNYQQQPNPDPSDARDLAYHPVPQPHSPTVPQPHGPTATQEGRSEPGFFRKSLASLGGFKKGSRKCQKDAKQREGDTTACSVCPHTETHTVAGDRKSNDKRPAKPKRKSLKTFSKLKENQDTACSGEQLDKVCFPDVDVRYATSPALTREGCTGMSLTAIDKSSIRERSVESCSSRLFGSRECSSGREVDLTGFDSGSLSGYESDFPRSKVHRSRSRIKTNPWLPSPQPPVAAGVRAQHCELDESREDVDVTEEHLVRVPRSASFENNRREMIVSRTPAETQAEFDRSCNQRPRSLTPSDISAATNVSPQVRSVSGEWWTPCQSSADRLSSSDATNSKLNDLNTGPLTSRPTCTVSPNSEFVMLADNLEQLASNISFDYEEMLDSTLESVSVCQEDGQASIHELLTDEENGNVPKPFVKCDGEDHSAHSPDSGIGGLGSTDGDYASSPNSQKEQSTMSLGCSPDSSNLSAASKLSEADANLEMFTPGKQNPQRNKLSVEAKRLTATVSHRLDSCSHQTSCGHKPSFSIAKHQPLQGDTSGLAITDQGATICGLATTDQGATLCESDVDNTSYHDSASSTCRETGHQSFLETSHQNVKDGAERRFHQNSKRHLENKTPGVTSTSDRPVFQCGNKDVLSDVRQQEPGRIPTLMVDERLDIQVASCHRQFLGSGLMLGSVGAKHEHMVGGLLKQTVCGTSAVVCCRNMRPSTFRTSTRGQHRAARMNDMEKGSGPGQPIRPWSGEYDFPRNIPFPESVESPTDNWRWGEQFAACCSQEAKNASQSGQQSTGDGAAQETVTDEGIRINGNEELVVQLHDAAPTTACQASQYATSQFVSGEDCSGEKLNNSSEDVTSQLNNSSEDVTSHMSDACVQTDFDDDFSKWDEADTLESLEGRAMDPAESTRLWLLTGNMQGSADTGYSSLTRDSLVFLDEDSLMVAGDLEERAAAQRLSYGESVKCDNLAQAVPSGKGCTRVDLQVMGVSADRGSSQGKEASDSLADGRQLSPRQDATPQATCGHNLLPHEPNPNPRPTSRGHNLLPHEPNPNPRRTSHGRISRTLPDYAISQTFSGERDTNPKHIHDSSLSYNFLTTRSSSDSSDRTLKSSDSDDLEYGAQSKTLVRATKRQDSETGEMRLRPVSSPPANSHLTSPPMRYLIQKNATPEWPQHQARANSWNTEGQSGALVDQIVSRRKSPTSFCERIRCSSVDLESAVSPNIVPGCERADYLEFLKDAPLNRSHLKRPLFLVPGLGPVDMSCSQQINLFADTEASQLKNSMPCRQTPCPPSSMSPSTAHCGKKLKFKKGDHVVNADHTPSSTRPEYEQHSRFVATSLSHVQEWLYGSRDQPSSQSLNLGHGDHVTSSLLSSECGADSRAQLHLSQNGTFKSSPQSQRPAQASATSPVCAELTSPVCAELTSPSSMTLEEKRRRDETTRCLRERVMSLRREQDVVFQKIQEARQDDRLRHGQRLYSQGDLPAQRKEALLETLQELKSKLEEQSKLLRLREGLREDM